MPNMVRPRTGSPCPLGLCQSIPEHGAGSHPSPGLSVPQGPNAKPGFPACQMQGRAPGPTQNTAVVGTWLENYERCSANLCYLWYGALIITLWDECRGSWCCFFMDRTEIWMSWLEEKGWIPFLQWGLIKQKSISDSIREKVRSCISTSY